MGGLLRLELPHEPGGGLGGVDQVVLDGKRPVFRCHQCSLALDLLDERGADRVHAPEEVVLPVAELGRLQQVVEEDAFEREPSHTLPHVPEDHHDVRGSGDLEGNRVRREVAGGPPPLHPDGEGAVAGRRRARPQGLVDRTRGAAGRAGLAGAAAFGRGARVDALEELAGPHPAHLRDVPGVREREECPIGEHDLAFGVEHRYEIGYRVQRLGGQPVGLHGVELRDRLACCTAGLRGGASFGLGHTRLFSTMGFPVVE
ncbi:MAG: hypothetical protein NTU62_03285 [Spirochaetes bacterium]|nr:hypothetical protein [Spirochaetota bacterium]